METHIISFISVHVKTQILDFTKIGILHKTNLKQILMTKVLA